MLNLEEIERKLLRANNAIATDKDGEEVLRGLNAEESNFVLSVEQSAGENVGVVESDAYRELRRKHLMSRQLHNMRARGQEPG